jgi:hypothetical protein
MDLEELKKLAKKLKKKEAGAVGQQVINAINTPGSEKKRIFFSKYISTQQNIDSSYVEVGIIHISEAIAVNALRQFVTDWANVFGNKGFDNTLFDDARNNGLQKMEALINKTNQKISNLRMDIVTIDESLIMLNFYGTLLQKMY